ncbi:MAG TPA: COX15/CtaA family protein [Chitinophagaceae bacterium]
MKDAKRSRPVAIWLLAGVGMLMIQVLLGGVTRLTGSGLSITEWKPIMGALPPLNAHQWDEAFEKYRQIAQFKYLNAYFTLSDFKSIFFWEWFHRLWARLIGVAFIIPFVIFLIQRRFDRSMVRPMVILFLLGALQGLVGWIMVMSGLEDSTRLYVSHYRLAIHFMLALVLICYALWFALQLLVPAPGRIYHPAARSWLSCLIAALVVQLVYGAFMAGLKAGPFAITWPDINGQFYPAASGQGAERFFDNPLVVQFIHRTLGYLLLLALTTFTLRFRKTTTGIAGKTIWLALAIACLQVPLGIITVINSANHGRLLWLGVSHQFVAMLLLLSLEVQYFLSSRKIIIAPAPHVSMIAN